MNARLVVVLALAGTLGGTLTMACGGSGNPEDSTGEPPAVTGDGGLEAGAIRLSDAQDDSAGDASVERDATVDATGNDGTDGGGDALADAMAEAAARVCSVGAVQCMGDGVQTCDSTGNWGAAAICASAMCSNGQCGGACAIGTHQCSGNGVETCQADGTWGDPVACTDQTCGDGACTGTCAPGATNPLPCGNCGVDTQTCDAAGSWQTSGTCAGQGVCADGAVQSCNTYGTRFCSGCTWGTCSCAPSPVCAPNATRCSGLAGLETCDACGQWSGAASCAYSCMDGACLGPECQSTPTSTPAACPDPAEDCCGNPADYTASCEDRDSDGGACPAGGTPIDCAGSRAPDGGAEPGECSGATPACCGTLVLTGVGAPPSCVGTSLVASCAATCAESAPPPGIFCPSGTFTIQLCTSALDCAGNAADTSCCSCGVVGAGQNPIHFCMDATASGTCGHCL